MYTWRWNCWVKKEDHDELLNLFDTASSNGRLIKFVPASGAASRMFQKLQSVLNRINNFTLDDLKNILRVIVNVKVF